MGANPYITESNLTCTPFGEHDSPRHPQWFASLFDLNRQTIDLLVDVAAKPHRDSIWSGWRKIGNDLGRLDVARRDELAHCPFTLVDVGIRKALHWSRADQVEPAQAELPFSPILLQTRLDHLAHAAYLLAWHLVRSDIISARLVFAMNSATAALMAQVTLTDIRRIAQEQVSNGQVRPRWHTRPDIWSRLIYTARSSERDTFANVTTHGLQLFLQELLVDEHGEVTERSA